MDDIRQVLQAELAGLSRRNREALELKVCDELSYPEVAERLGISQQTARARVSRGLRALALRIEDHAAIKEVRHG